MVKTIKSQKGLEFIYFLFTRIDWMTIFTIYGHLKLVVKFKVP